MESQSFGYISPSKSFQIWSQIGRNKKVNFSKQEQNNNNDVKKQ